MNRVLITGGTGCIGANLADALLQSGVRCRVLRRRESNLMGLKDVNVEYVPGDIRDLSSLTRAMEGCDTVFHTAAVVSFWKHLREYQYEVNVVGTRNVVAACRAQGVRKLVHTSSVAALGYRTDGGLIDENTPYNWGSGIGYKYSKHLGELEVLNGVQQGLDAVMVNPTVIIGPRDVYIHGGQFVRDIARKRVPAYLAGGTNVVPVRDVVQGHIAAARQGKSGERYILGGSNITHKELFTRIARVVGVAPPRIKAPIAIVRFVAKVCDLLGDVTKKQPWITTELISGAGKNNWYSSDKAVRELGYKQTAMEEAVREAYQWYRANRML